MTLVARAVKVRLACILAIAACVAIGCQVAGIAEGEAVEIARAHVAGRPEVILVRNGQLGSFVTADNLPEEPRGRLVWAVVLRGATPGECVVGQNGPVCPPPAATTLIVLDYTSGAFILSASPADLSPIGLQ